MFLRPYKLIVFNHLAKSLATISEKHPGKVAIDAASAGMKNIKLFKSLKYVGIDIDKNAIEKGLKHYPTAIGVHADLTQITLSPNSSIATVSTHTLEAIRSTELRNKFLRELINVTSSDGTMILLVYLKDDIELKESFDLIENSFKNITKSYYRLPVTKWFEDKFLISLKKIVERRPVAKVISVITLASINYALMCVEKLFSKTHAGQSVVLLECSGKKTGDKYNTDFNVDECIKVTSNYWVMSGL